MFLFKASGATYRKVLKSRLHAFPFSPAEVNGDELVLLSKNREDCTQLEKQVQAVAKLHRVRRATPTELDAFFPGVGAGDRWKYAVHLYWIRPLLKPFNLGEVKSLNAKRYATVQGFARFDEGDDMAILWHLVRGNEAIVLDIVNNAVPPDD